MRDGVQGLYLQTLKLKTVAGTFPENARRFIIRNLLEGGRTLEENVRQGVLQRD